MRGNSHRFLKGAMAGLLVLGLSACADTLTTNVTRFQSQLPAPQGQTFAVVADDASLAGGIEFSQYAQLVAGELVKKGYTQAATPDAANLIVRFSYGVDKGRVHVRSTGLHDPYWGPWYGGGRFGRGGWGGYGGGWGPRGGWGYGWYDPFFANDVESYTVYTSGVSLKIDSKEQNKRVFEGRAEAASTSNKLTYLVPNLVEAFFTGFPGNSGETLRITVAPEKKIEKK
jgi:hypothetical protein